MGAVSFYKDRRSWPIRDTLQSPLFFFSSLNKNLETAENLKKIIIILKKENHYYFDNQFILNHLGYFKNVLNGK